MKVVNFSQRSPEWYAWRNAGVSASDMLVVVGKSPYKTRYRLWLEKTGRYTPEDLSRNPNVARGVANEEKIREWIESQINDVLFPAVGESSTHSFIRCSFDGLCSKGVPYEMKSPTENGWNDVLNNRESSDQMLKYRYQIQTQILVAEASHGFMVFCSPDASAFEMIRVDRDEQLIQEIVNESRFFMGCLELDTPPPTDPERDQFTPPEEMVGDWLKRAGDYRAADEQIKRLEEQVKLLKQLRDASQDALIEMMAGFAKADFGGVQLSKTVRKGAIDYERMLKVLMPGLDEFTKDSYRKAGSESWRVTVRDEAIPKNCVDIEMAALITDFTPVVVPAAFF